MAQASPSNGSFKRKVLALLMGATLTLVAFEIILRGAGLFSQNKSNGVGASDREFRILCLGNSHTVGVGADPGQDYPSQLEGLLKLAHPNKKVRVLNQGLNNANTSEVLQILRQEIAKLPPDLVLLMTGEPNLWNRKGYDRFLKGQDQGANWLSAKLYSLLYELRLFRLVTLINRPQSDQPQPPMDAESYVYDYMIRGGGSPMAPLDLEEALPKFREFLKRHPRHRPALEFMGEVSRRAGFSSESLRFFESSLALDPEAFHYDVYQILRAHKSDYLRETNRWRQTLKLASRKIPGDLPKIQEWFEQNRLIEKSPTEQMRFLERVIAMQPARLMATQRLFYLLLGIKEYGRATDLLMNYFQLQPFGVQYGFMEALANSTTDLSVAASIAKFREEFRKRFPNEVYRLDLSRRADWVRSDLREMVSELQEHKIPFMLQTYCPYRNRAPRPENEDILAIAAEGSYPVSDCSAQWDSFAAHLNTPDVLFTQRFGPNDPHLSATGYRKLAQMILEDLNRYGLLKALSDP